MKRVKKGFEKRDLLLVLVLLLLLFGYAMKEHFQTTVQAPFYKEKLQAAIHAEEAMKAVKNEKKAKGLLTAREFDLNETGMIGAEWSGITSTLGSLEAKRTSANPNFAAVIVQYLKDAGVKKGDRVAVNFSGSFPSLNLSTLAAIETLELDPVILSSLGASTWGANQPELTYLDMERLLLKKGLLKNGTIAASLGGSDDIGLDFEPEMVNTLQAKLKKYGIPDISERDIKKNVDSRMTLYFRGGTPTCFINVGGNFASTAASPDAGAIHPGLIRSLEGTGIKSGGLVKAFLDKKIPVIYLLEMKELAAENGLPFDPNPLPKAGEGGIYDRTTYSGSYLAVLFSISAILLGVYIRLGNPKKGRSGSV